MPFDNNRQWMYSGNTTTTTTTTTRSHPRAGEIIDPYIMRCECGGRIGICGTAQGAAKWRSHMRTKKHYDWQGI